MLDKEILQYKVGALLYMPAFRSNIVQKISSNKMPHLTSAAFCLEDSIRDDSLDEAEAVLKNILRELEQLKNLPLVFVRIRSPRHLEMFHEAIGVHSKILTGYILPKVDMQNVGGFIQLAKAINDGRLDKPLYIMPTLESHRVASLLTRRTELLSLKQALDEIKSIVLNIRVGVNDFCNLYGLRRNINQTIYDIGVVRDVLIDIVNVFAKDYVVAGSVWNYFNGDNNGAWACGLQRELELDRANGFIGKTAIHPAQLKIIFDGMKVTQTDLDDANQLLNWKSTTYGVMKSADGSRMNEVKCHLAWAKRIKILGDLYGVKEFFKNHPTGIDGFISVDGFPRSIIYGGTGSYRYQVKFHNAGGHSMCDFGMPNPVHAMGRALAKIADVKVPSKPWTTFCAGVVDGGTSVNSIAHDCMFMLDIRSDSKECLDKANEEIMACIKAGVEEENARWQRDRAIEEDNPYKARPNEVAHADRVVELEIVQVGNRPAGSQSPDISLVQGAANCYRAFGYEPGMIAASSTDTNVPISLGVPGICIGGGGSAKNGHNLMEVYNPTGMEDGVFEIFTMIAGLLGVEGVSEPMLDKK